MRAVFIREPGKPDVLEIREAADPEPGPGEVRVRVRATALNRADLLQRRGLYPAPPDSPADIPGLEYAGEVEALGRGATRFKTGDRVMGIVGGGAYAEKLVVHERAAVRMPAQMDFPQAAAVPEAFLTAFDALFLQARLRPGDRVLIHAVGSGVGTAAVQLVKLAGATSVGTARSDDKLRRAKALGLDHGLLLNEPKFADAARKAAGGAGIDVVLDLVGGAYVEESLKAMAPHGREIVVGLMAGTTCQMPLGVLLNKRLQLIGTVLRSRPIEEKIAVAQTFEHQILPHFDSGRLVPVLDRIMSMADVRQAHELMESNANFGKIALAW